MRKRTVKNLCKEVFWHIVYFLPVIVALFSFLLFTTENYAGYLIDGKQDEKIEDLTGTTWEFNLDPNFYDSSEVGLHDLYQVNFFVSSLDYDDEFFIEIAFATDYFAEGGLQILYTDVDTAEVCVYDSHYSMTSEQWVKGERYRYITIIDGLDVKNVDLISMLENSAVLISAPSQGETLSVSSLFFDSFNSAFDVLGINFDKDVLFNAFKSVFVDGNILSNFESTSVLLKFASYYFNVHIIHLMIDCLLFIPKLAHKWIESLTRCE